MARIGRRAETARVFEGMKATSNAMDMRRLPELFCGFRAGRLDRPGLPAFPDSLALRDLALGDAHLSVLARTSHTVAG
jgi:hypothetical protein